MYSVLRIDGSITRCQTKYEAPTDTKPILIREVSFLVTLFYPWKNSLLVLVPSVYAASSGSLQVWRVKPFPYLMQPDDDMFHALCCVPVH
jgi:hypothetical protein